MGVLGAWSAEGLRHDVAGEVVARWRNWGAMRRLGCGQGGSVCLGDCKMLKEMRIFFLL